MRWFSEAKASRVLEAALAAGVTDFDTGPSYAGGNAEPRLGRLLAPRLGRDGVPGGAPRLSSKVGTKLGERGRLVKDFRPQAIHAQAAASLDHLGVPSLDVLYLHGPDEHELASSLPTLTKLKELGRVKAIGVCCEGPHVAAAAARPEVDWLMTPCNLLAQNDLPALRAARAAGKKVAVVAPLSQAVWRKDLLRPRTPSGAWYAARALSRGPDERRAARSLGWLREVEGWTPAALCLAWLREALGPELILTTTTNPAHIAESADALRRPVPPALAARLAGAVTG